MELDDLYARVLANIGDDEAAHSLEDQLRERALEMIADTSTDPVAVGWARIALRTSGLDFSRWCA